MSSLTMKIDNRFDGLSINELFSYFHLGKEKIKALTIYLNDKLINNKKVILKYDDSIRIEYDDKIDFLPFKQKLDILYEDDYLLIVNKPIGMLVHPDAKDKNGTLVNVISNYYHETNQNISVKYLHRIDMDTSGIVIVAKDILTNAYLAHLINEHILIRKYLCICSGTFKEDNGIYDFPIAEHRYVANKKRVGPTGKPAITIYKVLERMDKNLNLCEVLLRTGRTHQIRVHFSHAGHPLVGDSLYNGNTNLLKRQALHSYETIFYHPILDKEVHVKCELPNDMKSLYYKYKK